MKRLIGMILAIIVFPGIASSEAFMVELKGHYFIPSEEAFQDVYGGGIKFGAEASVNVWKGLAIWVGVSYFSKEGELTFTKEVTELKILGVGGGMKYVFPVKAKIDIYAAGGVNYYSYDEENVLGAVSKRGVGVVVNAGGLINIIKGLLFDVYINYSYCQMKPADFKINIGGFGVGIGWGYRF